MGGGGGVWGRGGKRREKGKRKEVGGEAVQDEDKFLGNNTKSVFISNSFVTSKWSGWICVICISFATSNANSIMAFLHDLKNHTISKSAWQQSNFGCT